MIKREVNIEEVEMLLRMATIDFCDFGASDSSHYEYLEEWRQKIGYSLKDLNKE